MGNKNTAETGLFANNTHCFYCGLSFNYIERPRHHCRECGSSICDQHSYFPPGTDREKRTCAHDKRLICQARKYHLTQTLRNNYEAYHKLAATEEDWNDLTVPHMHLESG
jgi:hypothetical protein